MLRSIGLITMFIWAILMMGMARRYYTRQELICGVEKFCYTPKFVFLTFLPLLIFAGFRDGPGYVDTNAYISSYLNAPGLFDEEFEYYWQCVPKDKGFTLYKCFFKTFFGDWYRPFIFCTAAFQCWAVARFFRRYSYHFAFSFFLFIASGGYFGDIFNGIRQFMAVCIILAGFDYFLQRRYFRYLFCILLAMSIHFSSVVMIPISFAIRGKPFNKKTMWALFVGIFACVATDSFVGGMETVLEGTQYSGYSENFGQGVNLWRVAFCLIPTVLAFLGREKLLALDNKFINVSINASIVTSSIWLIASVTSGITMGRLPIYVQLFNYILLPFELDVLFTGGLKRLAKIACIGAYSFFYFYLFVVAHRAISF